MSDEAQAGSSRSQDGRRAKTLFLGEETTSGTYLEGVSEEVVVEHGPVLAADVNDDLAEFVTDEIGNRFVLGQQEFGQAAADFHLVLWGDADPHLVHEVLEAEEPDVWRLWQHPNRTFGPYEGHQ